MLSRLVSWLSSFPGPDHEPEPERPRLDPLAMQVSREQRRIARRLARHTGRTPQELLDYHTADGLLARRR